MTLLRRHQATFEMPEVAGGPNSLEALGDEFELAPEPPTRRRVTWYETFDWRLHQAELRLRVEHEGQDVLFLSAADGTQLFLSQDFGPLGFAVDLPDGPLREALAPVIEMRRLLPFVQLDVQCQEFRVLNAEAKTVVRLSSVQGMARLGNSTSAQPLATTLEVRSVLGYDRAYHRLVEALEQRLHLERLEEDEFERASLAIGRHPGDTSSKVDIELDPDAPMVASARRIHLSLLAALQRNEDGTRRDLDSEFLHDFRVAVRRTRSALSQIKGVFPPACLAHFKAEFAWLGGLTGPTRDLDVYLLKLDDYKDALPPEVHQDLGPLRRLLLREQRREQRKMAKALGTRRYRQLLDDWQHFLQEGHLPNQDPAEAVTDPEFPAVAQQPTRAIASARIWKIYRRVIRCGTAIQHQTPAEAVHRVRIDCKKLRYMMEFMKGLYPAAEVTDLIKVLKRLQGNLGDFNDYEVQQTSLAKFAGRLLEVGEGSAATLLAMGRLQAHLAAGQALERRRFGKVFARFAAREHRERFRALFRGD